MALTKIIGRVIGLLIISIVLSAIILLMQHPIKYWLYLFFIILVGLLFFKLHWNNAYEVRFRLDRFATVKIVDYFFIICTLILLLESTLGLGHFKIMFSLLAIFLLPGWVLLRILKVDSMLKSNVELIVLSFTISIGLSSLIFLVSVGSGINDNSTKFQIYVSVIYFGLSLLPLIRHHLHRPHKIELQTSSPKPNKSGHNVLDFLILVWILVFFSFIISILYPTSAYITGFDIVRHYSSIQRLTLAPETYSPINYYPWAHFPLALIDILSDASMPVFQSSIAYLSIVVIFAFYIMARTYLRDISKHAAVLATVFFFIFAGFGWISYFTNGITAGPYQQHFDFLAELSNSSYNDIGDGDGKPTSLWFWFRPVTAGFTVFFVLAYLMRQTTSVTKGCYIIISSFLIFTLAQLHFPELVVWVFFVFLISLFVPSVKLRLKETAISILLGLSFAMVMPIIAQFLPSVPLNFFSSEYINLGSGPLALLQQYLLLHFPLAGLSAVAFVLVRYPNRPNLSFLKINYALVALIGICTYLILLVEWLVEASDFSLDLFYTVFSVPWEFYPTMLGVSGLLAIPGALVVVKKYHTHPILVFVILPILIVFLGKIITYFNVSYFETGYWEIRLVPLVYSCSSILSSIVFLRIIESLKLQYENRIHKKLIVHSVTAIILSFLVLVGSLSTHLSIEYDVLRNSKNAVADEDVSLSYSLDPYSDVLTFPGSKGVADYTHAYHQIEDFNRQIWSYISPELPLNELSRTKVEAPTVLLSENDIGIINRSTAYSNSYFVSNILSKVPPMVNISDSGRISKIPALSPPVPESDTMLVLPDRGVSDKSHQYFQAYDLFSMGGYNYTTVLISDIGSISKAGTIIAPTEDIALKIMDYRNKYSLQYKQLIILNLDGYGRLTEVGASPISLLENNAASSKWASTGIGAGKIGVPKVEGNASNKILKSDSLTIDVDQGEYRYWQISRLLNNEPLNLTTFDFVKFRWYGRDDGKWYNVQFTSGPGEHFWYRFQDTWQGWNDVILPLKVPDQKGSSFGVTYNKASGDGATWAKIVRIDFMTGASNIDQSGTFYLDGFYFGNILRSSSIRDMPRNEEILLNTSINVYPINLIGYETLSYYDAGVPFLLQKKYDDSHEVFYINIFPITHKIIHENNHVANLIALGTLLEPIGLSKFDFSRDVQTNAPVGGEAAFGNVTVDGSLSIESPTAIIDLNSSSIVRANIDGSDLALTKVSQLIPLNTSNLTLYSKTGGKISGGPGFYTHVLSNESSIHFKGDPVSLLVIVDGEKNRHNTTTTISGNNIQVNVGKSVVSVRQPKIVLNGTVEFDDFYGYGNRKLLLMGQDIKAIGQVEFESRYSDSASQTTTTENLFIDGNIIPLVKTSLYDEFGNLNDFSPDTIIKFILIVSGIYFIFKLYTSFKRRGTEIWRHRE